MTEMEFVEATGRIEKYYEKEFNEFQRKFWFDNLKNIPIENYKKIVDEILRNCKYFPKFADVKEIIKNTKFERQENKEKIHVKCELCGSTGLIKYYTAVKNGDKELKYEYLARCICQNKENYDWKDKEGNPIFPEAVELNLI